MSETELVLLIITVILLVLLVWQTGRIRSRLARIEARLSGMQQSFHEKPDEESTATESNAGGLFESFLDEDPSRRAMSKSEQFAAFRQWRKEKGLSWSSNG